MFMALLLFLSVAAGPVIVLGFKLQDRRKIRLLTTFSGAYVFSVTALHLLPEAFGGHTGHDHGHGHDHGFSTHLPGLLILAGFFLQLTLDYFSEGIEHGHAHVHEEDRGHLPVGVLFGLCIHAFLEGMPLGGADHGGISPSARQSLVAGIVMHNIPVSVVLMTLLLHQGIRLRPALWWMFVFACMSPLGMWLSDHIHVLSHYSHELMAVVVGIFLHISTTILFETGEEHRFNRLKVVAIVLGAGLALAGTLLIPHAH
jgi:zinc and cadmium transporter